MILLGDSGAGKTSALATLANAGYKLRILDFDNGLDILGEYLKDKEAIERVDYHTLRDGLTTATAYKRALALLKDWKTDDKKSLGSVRDWGEDTVLVIDSLTFLSQAIIKNTLQFNGRKLTDQLQQQDWGTANRDLANLINFLTNDEEGEGLKCNLIVMSHIQFVEDATGKAMAYPVATTRAFSTTVPAYFNVMMRLDRKPGKTAPILRTQSDHRMSLKSTNPSKIPAEIEGADLSVVFKAMQSNIKEKTENKKLDKLTAV
jgi:hypothetical protein